MDSLSQCAIEGNIKVIFYSFLFMQEMKSILQRDDVESFTIQMKQMKQMLKQWKINLLTVIPLNNRTTTVKIDYFLGNLVYNTIPTI